MKALTVLQPVRWAGHRAIQLRTSSTLSNNRDLYSFPHPQNPSTYILSFLSTEPPTASLAVGTTTKLPPEPRSFTPNPQFLPILQSVIAENASSDPEVQSQAAVMISNSGAAFFRPGRRQDTGSAGASDQGGYGSGGRGGWLHVFDNRRIPDFGRIPDPEDIFGSVEVDGEGKFVDGHGRYSPSGTYRIVTNDGILGLSDFLKTKLVERLKLHEAAEKNKH
jgi:hypothetical protein